MNPMVLARRSEGFTLVELLVVVSIIAILSFTVVTNLGSVRGKARDAKIQQDLSEVDKAITLAIANEGTVAVDAMVGKSFAQVIGTTGVVTALRPKYIPNNAEVAHPVTGKNYMFKGVKVGGEMTYFLCAELESPKNAAEPFFIVENGSSYDAANANACQ